MTRTEGRYRLGRLGLPAIRLLRRLSRASDGDISIGAGGKDRMSRKNRSGRGLSVIFMTGRRLCRNDGVGSGSEEICWESTWTFLGGICSMFGEL